MKRQHGSVNLIILGAALLLCLPAGPATAADVAWDMVSSTSSGLLSYTNSVPGGFTSPGDGFQKYVVGEGSIPFALVDDSGGDPPIYADDTLGIINSAVDFNVFFGVCDTENGDNAGPVTATWVFDIAGAQPPLNLRVDLAAMGDFEAADVFEWTYSVDGGTPVPIWVAAADEAGSFEYTLADGDQFIYDDPLMVDGVMLTNNFATFTSPVGTGSELTVTLTVVADGGSEGYVARNLAVSDASGPPSGGGEPIPTLSQMGVMAMTLLLLGAGVFLIRRLH